MTLNLSGDAFALEVGDEIESSRILLVTGKTDHAVYLADPLSEQEFTVVKGSDQGSWRYRVKSRPKKKTVADFKVGDTIEGDDYQLDWPTGTHVKGLSTRLTRAGSRWITGITEYDHPAPPTAFECRRTIQFIPGR